MRIAYFDCVSGISGDMTLGALVDAGASLEKIQAAVHAIGLEQVKISAETVKKGGFRAVQVRIEHPPERAHRHLHHIEAMFDKGNLAPEVRSLASRIFLLIGQAEAKVHGTDLKKVHFHEVGAIDSIADILGVSVALADLGIQRVEASPVPTGSGSIVIDHGRVSVPAPATAELLLGIPLASSQINGELTTPTGAGILKATCERFGPLPAMQIEKIGYGAGTKDWEGQANILRVLIGQPAATAIASGRFEIDRVWVLETNIDDAMPTDLAVMTERLMSAGALDVYQTPCVMKKGRSGILLSVLAENDRVDALEQLLFGAGLTLGIRRMEALRHKLIRQSATVDTEYGAVLGKCAWLPEGRWRFAPELEALKTLAAEKQVSLETIRTAAINAFKPPPDIR